MKRTLFILAFIGAFSSCDNSSRYVAENAPQTDTIYIDIDNAKRYSYLHMFEKIDYILTPYDSAFCIGKVDKLLITDSLLFVMDRKISRGISS